MAATQGIKLDEATKERLKALGDLRDRSPHWLMRTAILEYLEREEVREREKKEDSERWERYQLTGEFTSHQTIMDWLEGVAQGSDPVCQK
ncbi:MAG: ribbon-helix-helix protein, CopG family [Rhodospirillales bacterium]|nr:ribbon-helix-helix protein, CopG family [Rhodospirillales bacterium]